MNSQTDKEIQIIVNKTKSGKGIKIGEGGFGKVYKITKIKKIIIYKYFTKNWCYF